MLQLVASVFVQIVLAAELLSQTPRIIPFEDHYPLLLRWPQIHINEQQGCFFVIVPLPGCTLIVVVQMLKWPLLIRLILLKNLLEHTRCLLILRRSDLLKVLLRSWW